MVLQVGVSIVETLGDLDIEGVAAEHSQEICDWDIVQSVDYTQLCPQGGG